MLTFIHVTSEVFFLIKISISMIWQLDTAVKIAYAFYLNNWHDAYVYLHNIQLRIIKNIQAIFPELHNANSLNIFN